MSGPFNTAALERARFNLNLAKLNLQNVQGFCGLAKAALEDAGRDTQAAAIEMICASLNQSERDVIKWTEMIAKTRENGHG